MKVKKGESIYLDNAATTPVRKEVMKAMMPFFTTDFGNAGSIHAFGVRAKQALEHARIEVAQTFNARPQDIIFTAGGTAGNNSAILGVIANALQKEMKYDDMHIVTTNIEHSSVKEVYADLARRGVRVTVVPVESNGIVNPRAIHEALRKDTILVSVMYANNEIGTIQPIREIAKEIRHFKKHVLGASHPAQLIAPYFHVDACQAPLYLPLNTAELGADSLVIDGQKINGPKGVGALWIRTGVPVSSISFGGGQERGLHQGTENIPLIVGFAKACTLAKSEREKELKRLLLLRDFCISEIEKNFPQVRLNGDRDVRLPNNINVSIPKYDTEFLTLQLDARGIAVSTKSACLDSGTGSYVVSALGGEAWRAQHTLRLSLGQHTTKKDIVYLIDCLKNILTSNR